MLKTTPEAHRKRLNRINELPLLYMVMLFQFASMLLLTFRDGVIDTFSLQMSLYLPIGTYVGLKLFQKLYPIDRCIYILIAFLSSLGVILLRAVFKTTKNASDQATFLLIGYVFMLVSAGIVRRVRSWDKLSMLVMPFSLLFLCLPFVFGSPTATADSWVKLGSVQFQPSELIKPVLIVVLAAGFSRREGWGVWWKYVLTGALSCGILFLQPDLGAVFLYFIITVAMFYAGTGRYKATIAVLLIAVAGVTVFLSLLDKIDAFGYLASRIAIWENPFNSAYEDSRQIVQGLISIASGGLFGSGLGLGSADRVAVVASDYIFAAVSEEFGMVFAISVLMVYLIILVRGAIFAMNARVRFHALIAFGCVFALSAQMLLIVCGNLHLIPLTGVTLPFVSGGGSSMLSSMIQAGLLLGVSSVSAQDEYDDLLRISGGEWREKP